VARPAARAAGRRLLRRAGRLVGQPRRWTSADISSATPVGTV
jgi:hypothetical protein